MRDAQCRPHFLQMVAMFAEYERTQISTRTKAVLAQATARGTKLANPRLSEVWNARNIAEADSYAQKIGPVLKTMRGWPCVGPDVRRADSGIHTDSKRGAWTRQQLIRIFRRLEPA